MKKLILFIVFLFFFRVADAQAVFIGPTSQLQWDIVAVDIPTAQSLTYSISVDSGSAITLTGVTCAASNPVVAGTQTCSVLLTPQIPLGTHSITMTAASGVLVSSPSSPFAYIDLLVPIPKNLRVK